jgi:hypothetical protein
MKTGRRKTEQRKKGRAEEKTEGKRKQKIKENKKSATGSTGGKVK